MLRLKLMITEPLPYFRAGDFRAFLFDLDGTVADSMPIHYQGWVAALAEHGATFPEPLFYQWGGIPPARIVEMLNERDGHTMSPAAIVARKEALYFDLLPQLQPVASVLEHMKAAHGKTLFAIVSGSPRESITRTLEFLHLSHYFPVIVGAEGLHPGQAAPGAISESRGHSGSCACGLPGL